MTSRLPVIGQAKVTQVAGRKLLKWKQHRTQGWRSEKNGGGLKGSEGETHIRVDGGVLLRRGESSQKL